MTFKPGDRVVSSGKASGWEGTRGDRATVVSVGTYVCAFFDDLSSISPLSKEFTKSKRSDGAGMYPDFWIPEETWDKEYKRSIN